MAPAQSGTWTTTASGQYDYNDTANWAGGIVATGAGNTANFSTVNIDGDMTIVEDLSLTIGNLLFGDTNTSSGGNWLVGTNNASTITLDNNGATPNITVNPLAAGASNNTDAQIFHSLIGTMGFNKLGNGILTLATGTTNTITGGINVNAGTLRVAAAFPAQTVTLANGTTYAARANNDATGTRIFSVASGDTANLSIETSSEIGRFDAAGANINVSFPATIAAGTRFTPSGNWLASSATANPASFTVNSAGPAPTAGANTGAVVRLAPNNNSANGGIRNFNGATFATSPVTLNNTLLYCRTNSGGNTFTFGSLAGDSTAILSGGNQGGAATFSIGGLNTDTTFAGTIDTASSFAAESTAANTGGLNLLKVGTGTLTLSGTLDYSPTLNGTTNRRGGVTTVSVGKLALTNNAAIAGGTTDGVNTQNSVVNILSGAMLDVSGSTIPGGYSTAPLQTVLGAGTVVGNYVHDEGILAPADTVAGATGTNPNPASLTAVGGTIVLQNNLVLSGGTIKYDMTTNPAAGNDLISVGGVTTLTSGTIAPNFLTVAPSSGTYTVITSTGGFSGAASNVTVDWPGRGADPVPFITGNSLQFTATNTNAGANLKWTGDQAEPTAWDVQTTQNWLNGAVHDTFFQLDSVTFDDTASSFTVVLNTAVQPTSIVVNNPVNDYSITGGGSIGGTATFTKQGAGSLIFQLAGGNTFSGAASIQGGTVDIGAQNAALGTGVLTMAGGKLIAANGATAALTNSSIAVGAGTNSIQVDGTAGNPLAIPALTGTGTTMTLTTTVQAKLIDLSGFAGFTGTLNVGADNITSTALNFRLNGAGSGGASTALNMTNGASLRDRATSAQVIPIGSLTGDSTTNLMGYQGGSGATAKTWEIGALNTSTTFEGTIVDGAGSAGTTAVTNISKVGTGTLTLTGANTYAGTTTVNGGKLLVNGNHSPNLTTTGAAPNYVVNAGGTLGGTGTIGDGSGPLTVTVNSGGTLSPGASIGTLSVLGDVALTAGSIFKAELNAATNSADLLAVTGNLNLGSATLMPALLAGTLPSGPHIIATYSGALSGTFTVPSGVVVDYGTFGQISMTVNSIVSVLIGDYNNNGTVDAADYVVWRKNVGAASIPNRDPGNPGVVGPADYNSWKANFGKTGPGAGAGLGSAGSVPEPTTWMLAGLALVLAGGKRRRK